MNKASNRKTQRQQFLRKQAKHDFVIVASSVVMIVLIGFTMLCLGIAFFGASSFPGRLILLSIGVGIMLAIRRVLLMVSRVKKELANTPWVPPVTVDTLPADEILVRGSEEPPVTQSEILLRMAQQGQETPKEELLRVTGQE